MAEKPLYPDILPVPELYKLKVVPIRADLSNISFGVTTTTSQPTMAGLQARSAPPVPRFACRRACGRPARLTRAQRKELLRVLKCGALAFGFETDRWTRG